MRWDFALFLLGGLLGIGFQGACGPACPPQQTKSQLTRYAPDQAEAEGWFLDDAGGRHVLGLMGRIWVHEDTVVVDVMQSDGRVVAVWRYDRVPPE